MRNIFNNLWEYDNTIPKEVCSELIRHYEATQNKERFENNLKPQFTQITLSVENSKMVLPFIEPTLNHYKNMFPYLPKTCDMELVRIKKYEPNTDDQFDWHCDAIDKDSSSRYVAILCYLNDGFIGGETDFEKVVIQPKEGKIVIFPPTWEYPHRGLPVLEKPKYIMSTYLRF